MHAESVVIYVLIDPRDQQIRYVGQTQQSLARRLADHCRTDRPDTSHKGRWVARLLRLGLRPSIQVVQTVDQRSWPAAERYWIGYYRSIGCSLTNGTEGGDGGNRPTPAARAKLSAAKRGVKREPFSDIWRQRMGESHRKTHCLRGHAYSPANTRVRGTHRWCRQCDVIRARRYREERKQTKRESELHGDM
jgi:hypothetical protein